MASAVALARALPVPVLDEETWLWLARNAPLARPYDWWRPGPPWGDAAAADAFLFAHPPLFIGWLKLVAAFTADLSEMRRLAALPWAALLGLALGALAERGPRPWLALALALGGPAAVLALGRGLMPDLMATSLLLGALAAWCRAWAREGEPAAGWLALGGLALGLAALTRYTALILAPALLIDLLRRRRLGASWPFWLCFGGPWLAGEAWLAALYGRVHLFEVLTRAGEIPRGPVEGRGLGALVRLGLVLGPAALLALRPAAAAGAFLLGGGALALGWPAELGAGERAALLALATLGAMALVGGAARAARGGHPQATALGALGLLVFAGVVLGHNYAASRYLLPGALALALLLGSGRPRVGERLLVLCQIALAVFISHGEAAYARAADEVARAVVEKAPAPGVFTGEWTFRWRMEQAGWSFRVAPPAAGALVAVPREASPGFGAGEGWEPVLRAASGPGRPRLLDLEAGVGFYAETLGPLPLGLGAGPLEEATLWRAR